MHHPLVLAARPSNDIGVDPAVRRAQLRPIEVAVVGDPAADRGIVDRGQLVQGLVAAFVKRPAANFAADARQRRGTDGRHEAVREDAPILLHPHDLPGTVLVAQKIEADDGIVAPPVHILAVDDLRLLRMQHQLAGRRAVRNRTPQGLRLLLGFAVTDHVVGVTLERDVRELAHHPHVEGVVQEQVRQKRMER